MIDWTDCTIFQLYVLESIARLETSGEQPYGLAIREGLQTRTGTGVTRGRLYQNLDKLVTQGWLAREALDGRTNAYRLTDRGWTVLEERAQALMTAIDGSPCATLDGGSDR